MEESLREVREFILHVLRSRRWRKEDGAEYTPLYDRRWGIFGVLAISADPRRYLENLDPEYEYELRGGFIYRRRK